MAEGLKLDSIRQIGVNVDDLDSAVGFYGEKLGLKFISRVPVGIAFFDCAGVRLMLSSVAGESGSGGNSVLYFDVPDIQAGYEELKSRGIEFTHEPHIIHSAENYELWMAFFTDPEGNSLAIVDERGEYTG